MGILYSAGPGFEPATPVLARQGGVKRQAGRSTTELREDTLAINLLRLLVCWWGMSSNPGFPLWFFLLTNSVLHPLHICIEYSYFCLIDLDNVFI